MGRKTTKHTIKYLSHCRDPQLISDILKQSNQGVTKAICNAAYNVTQGEVPLSRSQKQYFARNRKVLAALTSKKQTLNSKHKLIQSGGAFPLLAAIIPPLLTAVLTTVGTQLFSK